MLVEKGEERQFGCGADMEWSRARLLVNILVQVRSSGIQYCLVTRQGERTHDEMRGDRRVAGGAGRRGASAHVEPWFPLSREDENVRREP